MLVASSLTSKLVKMFMASLVENWVSGEKEKESFAVMSSLFFVCLHLFVGGYREGHKTLSHVVFADFVQSEDSVT